MRTTSGRLSATMLINGAFLVLWLVTQIFNAFGFGVYEPPTDLVIIAPALVAIINMIIRYINTREPIAKP